MSAVEAERGLASSRRGARPARASGLLLVLCIASLALYLTQNAVIRACFSRLAALASRLAGS